MSCRSLRYVILRDLPLVEPVKEALLNRSGAMGDALKCIEACERCEWAKTSLGNLAESTIRDAYLTGVIWTRGMPFTAWSFVT